VEGLEAQLRRAGARADDAAQPYNYLAERIYTAEVIPPPFMLGS
jgi:hypothetical protein